MEKPGEFINNPLSSLNLVSQVTSQTLPEQLPLKTNVKQEEIHDLLFSKEIEWQEIIYDLINTEQLNPWDIDLIVLTEKYFQRITEMEERDFFVSSKVLLAASFLLRIKSEILLNKYIKSIDDILFGNKVEEVKKHQLERIELEDEIPGLIPRSPLPRFRKVTLKELLESLNKAIITENRRIKKEIVNKNALRESSISLPKRKFSIKDKIIEITSFLDNHFSKNEIKKITFTELAGEDREKRIEHFSPLLHLENQKKIWLEQQRHFEEIHIWEKEHYWNTVGNPFQDLITELKDGTYEEVSEEEFEKFSDKNEEGDDEELNKRTKKGKKRKEEDIDIE